MNKTTRYYIPLMGLMAICLTLTACYSKQQLVQVKAYENTVGLPSSPTLEQCYKCHIDLAAQNDFPKTEEGALSYMGVLHQRKSGIDFTKIDVNKDGVFDSVRCIGCHLSSHVDTELRKDSEIIVHTAPGYPGFRASRVRFAETIHNSHLSGLAAILKGESKVNMKICFVCHLTKSP